MPYSLIKLLELGINNPKRVLTLGRNKINPSTAGKLEYYSWEDAIQQKIIPNVTKANVESLFNKLEIKPEKVAIEKQSNLDNPNQARSIYIYGKVNNEPIIYSNRQTPYSGQLNVYSKYKAVKFMNLTNNPYYQRGVKNRDILRSKDEILNLLKIPTNNEQPITEEETFYGGGSNYFKCYRTAAIGLGSGMQAYGWGLYFAKDVNMANGYAGVGSNSGKKMILFQGKNPAELAFEYDCIIFERLPSALTTIDEFIEYAQDMIELLSDDGDNPELISEYKRFIEIIKELNIEQEPMKYVYEVLLHKGKKPSEYEYLNWDISIPQNQINKINNQAKKEHLNFQISSGSGSNVYHNIESYFKSKGSANAPKDASLFLLRSGIDGNTHSNGSVRIIFDEKAITIVNVCKKS